MSRFASFAILKPLIVAALAVACFFACAPSSAFASCIPSQSELEAYEADGTLAQRQAYQKALGNDSFDQELLEGLQERQSAASSRSARGKVPPASVSGMPLEGTAKVLALRVSFPAEGDEEAMAFDEGDTLNALQAMIDGTADAAPYESLNAYYGRSSYGRLSFTGRAYDYAAKHCRSYYTDRVDELFREAVTALKEQGVDVASFDGNEDGMIDGVYLHFAGKTTGWGTTWWSNHRKSSDTEPIEGTQVRLGSEILLHEPANENGSTETIIHETGHALGLPDFYSYKAGSSSGINTHDMMFDNVGDQCAFSKWVLGWISNPDITRVKVSNDGVWVKRGDGEPEHFDGSVTEALQSMNLSDKETGGFVAVAGDLTSSVDGRSFDLFDEDGLLSSFYLLQLDNQVGNQDAESVLENGALRMYRVQAELDDSGSDFLESNAYGVDGDKLIEALGAEGDGFNALKQGASVTPFTNPSTNYAGGLAGGFTGISVERTHGEEGQESATLSYVAKEPIDPSDFSASIADASSVQCIDSRTLSFSMSTACSEDPNKYPTIVFDSDPSDDWGRSADLSSVDGEIRVSWALDPAEFQPGKRAELVLPEGLFILGRDSSGTVYAPEVRIPISAAGSESMLAPESTSATNVHLPDSVLREPLSDVLTQSNGSKLFFVARGFNPDEEGSESNGCLLLNRVDESNPVQCTSVPVEGTGGGWLSELGIFQHGQAGIEAKLLDDNTAVVFLRSPDGYGGVKKTCAWVDLSQSKVIAQAEPSSDTPNLLSCQGSLVEARRTGDGLLLIKSDARNDGSVQESYAIVLGASAANDAGSGNVVVSSYQSGEAASGAEMKVLDGQAFSSLRFADSLDEAFDEAVSFSDLACAYSFESKETVSIDAAMLAGDSLVVASHDVSTAEGEAAPLASRVTKYPLNGGSPTSCTYENRISSEDFYVRLSSGADGAVVANVYTNRVADPDGNQPSELVFFDSSLQTAKYSAGYGGPCSFWQGSNYMNLGYSALASQWDKTDWLRCDEYKVAGGSDPVEPVDPSDPAKPNPAADSGNGAGSSAGQGAEPSVSARTGDSPAGPVALCLAACAATCAVSVRRKMRRNM